MANVKAQLNSLNTHFVGYIGVFLGFLGFITTVPQAGQIILGLLPLDIRPTVTAILALVGLGMAYYGRPHTVEPSDAVQVAVADAIGDPRPVTLAKESDTLTQK